MYLDDLFDLSGRGALITGGSSGLGLAIARTLGLAGARVVLVARRGNMILIGIVGSLLAALLRWVERLLCPWRREMV